MIRKARPILHFISLRGWVWIGYFAALIAAAAFLI